MLYSATHMLTQINIMQHCVAEYEYMHNLYIVCTTWYSQLGKSAWLSSVCPPLCCVTASSLDLLFLNCADKGSGVFFVYISKMSDKSFSDVENTIFFTAMTYSKRNTLTVPIKTTGIV